MKSFSSMQYTPSSINRADIALRCAPFHLSLFTAMRSQSVPLSEIAGKTGFQQGYTQSPLSELRVESELVWLIKVGILRREVDGQGITDSFRLTPLGQQLVAKWEEFGVNLPLLPWWQRLAHLGSRWLRLPI